MTMQSYSLEEYPTLQKWTRRSQVALLIVTLISGIFVYRGIKAYGLGGDDGLFQSFFGPLLLAFVSLLIAMFGYSYLFERYPLARTPQERTRLHFIIAFIAVVLLSTSTYFAMIGLASERCLLRSLESGLLQAEKVFDEMVMIRRTEKSLLAPLKLGAGQSKVLVKSEHEGGPSGRKGIGRVSATLKGLQSGYEDIADTLESSITAHENASTEGQIILEDIRGILNDGDLGVREKSEMIVPLFNELNAQLTELRLSAVPAVLSFVQNVDDLYLSKGAYMESVLDAIRKPVEKTKQEVLKQVTLIRRQKEPVIPRFHVMDAEQAIFEYPQAVWAALVYTLSLDIGFPLMCLTFLVNLSRRESRTQVTTGRSWSHGYSETYGRSDGVSESDPRHGHLWNTNPAANRKGDKPGQDNRNRPEPPVA
jgi:hypothetical protein